MRSKDQILLEGIYEKILLKENRVDSIIDKNTIKYIKTEIEPYFKNQRIASRTPKNFFLSGGKTINTDNLSNSDIEMIASDLWFNSIDDRNDIYMKRDSEYYGFYYGIAKAVENSKDYKSISNMINRNAEKGIKITKYDYDRLGDMYDPDYDYAVIPYQALYLTAIQIKELNNVKFLTGISSSAKKLVEQNKDSLTFFDKILYPISDMDRSYFSGIYENIFKNFKIQKYDFDESLVTIEPFTDENKNKYEKIFKEYFADGYDHFIRSLEFLVNMVYYQFKDDPHFKETGDYSPLLTLAEFTYN
jgi:hypothetical protein